jgi:hypothetical protein
MINPIRFICNLSITLEEYRYLKEVNDKIPDGLPIAFSTPYSNKNLSASSIQEFVNKIILNQ